MPRRSLLAGLALLAATLVIIAGAPHAHANPGGLTRDDCVLCHAQHAPFVESERTDTLIDFAPASRSEFIPDEEERDAALGCHPSRAPPA
jgi:hypothetical protein